MRLLVRFTARFTVLQIITAFSIIIESVGSHRLNDLNLRSPCHHLVVYATTQRRNGCG